MDSEAAPGVGLSLPVPQNGLAEVLRSWNGRGRLWSALSAAGGDELAERQWTPQQVRQRAHRVVFEQLLPHLVRWPTTVDAWLEALPAEIERSITRTPYPSSGTSWRATRLLGWPPKSFVNTNKHRVADTQLVTTLRWTLDQLGGIRNDATRVDPTLVETVGRQLRVADELMNFRMIQASMPARPSRQDLKAVRAEGKPWNVVGDVAEVLRHLDEAGLVELAQRFVMPDEALRGRLFHLGVLGELLLIIKSLGGRIESVRPLSSDSAGPAYKVYDLAGGAWDLWFEAAGAWGYYEGIRSPYMDVTRSFAFQNRPLGADLMLCKPRERAIVIECKYSRNQDYVARSGYHQTVAYATEIRSELAPEVMALLVAPETLYGPQSVPRSTTAGSIVAVPPSGLRQVIANFLGY